ncbi:DUF4426 domain-containing protein [Pseudoxanthomonas sp. LH2527]|uniref:DUF4426 domain-containing protein n=1 Tax=Pseudoxanthomonas sp. LH2527 TaxID=2923249 RepID=UPI001F144AAE|nr:DUF4426 domain-containing protein [Pseudoxanthomonas sp. LH2527]MCH6483272.1 DUF4426 domain-containing protein [Pseudoxanthomonas sp. LH2527]
MKCIATLSAIALLGLLSACSGGEAPRTAEFVQASPAEADFGNLRVRYNALPTLALSAPVAQQYGVPRDADTALVLVALREIKGGEEVDAEGDVAVSAHDLSGTRQTLTLRKVDAGGYTDHIGTARISPRNSYRFEVVVTAGGRTETVKFQRNF